MIEYIFLLHCYYFRNHLEPFRVYTRGMFKTEPFHFLQCKQGLDLKFFFIARSYIVCALNVTIYGTRVIYMIYGVQLLQQVVVTLFFGFSMNAHFTHQLVRPSSYFCYMSGKAILQKGLSCRTSRQGIVLIFLSKYASVPQSFSSRNTPI